MIVYEILDSKSNRLIFVEQEAIARELCLVNTDFSCRPVFVAETFGGAEIELMNLR